MLGVARFGTGQGRCWVGIVTDSSEELPGPKFVVCDLSKEEFCWKLLCNVIVERYLFDAMTFTMITIIIILFGLFLVHILAVRSLICCDKAFLHPSRTHWKLIADQGKLLRITER